MSDIVPDRHRATAPLLFEAQAERTPGAIALIHGETALTYARLNAEANRTAHHLIALGFGPEDIVAIALPRSAAAIGVILGVLKAGAAYLPLDLRSPSRRLARVLDHARPAAIISSRAVAPACLAVTASPLAPSELAPSEQAPSEQAAPTLIVIDDEETVAAVARQRTDNPGDRDRRRPLTAGNAAYVIYTSGSTGQPKGVVVTHTGLAPLAAAQVARLGVTADSRVLQFASLGFDASVFEMLMAFSTGASLIVIDDDDRTGAMLCRTVIARRITHATFPPALLATLSPADLPVPNIVVAGEACPASVAAQWSAGRRLINAYGPTETTVCATMTPPLSGGGAPSIGTPIEECRVYVLDDDLRPVPAGATGEICVAGPAVARGYLHQPQLTAERFVEDPFLPAGVSADSRMYRTGDIGRWRPDGELEFLGRRDRQVKVGGVRIELGEVEAAMREHPAVIDALVLANDGVRLTGYAVCRQTEAERREHDARHVEEWRRVYDDDAIHAASDGDQADDANADDIDAETRGWSDSYTGQPIPADEMRAWAEEKAGRIRALRPRRVLEIGCGTGLLLTRLAPSCERYVGTDLAPAVLRRLARRIARVPQLSHVELKLAAAGDLTFADDDSVDVVVLNSVIQYFPSVDYLLGVLRAALRVVGPDGHIYLGDVRSLPLLEAFHTSVQLHHASRDVPARELRRRIARAMRDERELVLSPELFEELRRNWPELGRIEILSKTGVYDNELSRYRYDVLMTLGPKHAIAAQTPPAAHYRRFGTSPSWLSFGRAHAAVLRDRLRASLPAAMVPERIVVLAEWPMTVNGKIDRDALPEPALESSGSNLAPRSAEEEILHGLYAELLDRREIGLDEDFFTLGGHSLMAARLAGRIRAALNVDVPIRTVFESPSIAALARRLWETRDGGVAFTTRDRPARIPLASVQQRLWSLDRRDGGSPQYNLLRAVRIDGELDVPALERAINGMVARHDVLRASFHADEDDDARGAFQVIAPELRVTIPLHDLSELDPRERQARVRRFLLADASRPFDLTQAPVMRLALLKIAAHSHVLVRCMHYIVKDGWSEALFNRELSCLYRQHHRGDTPALEPLALQYADFAVWQRRSLEAGAWARGLAYWKRQLRDGPPAASRRRTSAAAPAATPAGELDTTIGPEDTSGLRRLNHETGTTLYMTLLAALGVALTRGGHDHNDIVIGAPVANRPVPQLEQVIGCFANPLPLRLRITPAMTPRELLLQVRQTTLAAYQHQDVPYEQLIEELWPERRGERAPGFQTLLAYHNVPWEPLRLDGLLLEPVKWPQLHARIELEVNAWLIGAWGDERRGTARVGVTWTFARDAYEPARIESIAREFSLAIAAMAGTSSLDTPLDLAWRPDPGITLPLAQER